MGASGDHAFVPAGWCSLTVGSSSLTCRRVPIRLKRDRSKAPGTDSHPGHTSSLHASHWALASAWPANWRRSRTFRSGSSSLISSLWPWCGTWANRCSCVRLGRRLQRVVLQLGTLLPQGLALCAERDSGPPTSMQSAIFRRSRASSANSSRAGSWSAGSGRAPSCASRGQCRTPCSRRTWRAPDRRGSSWSIPCLP